MWVCSFGLSGMVAHLHLGLGYFLFFPVLGVVMVLGLFFFPRVFTQLDRKELVFCVGPSGVFLDSLTASGILTW